MKTKKQSGADTLDTLGAGEKAVIERLGENCAMKKRFTDLGICPGEEIAHIMTGPLGDPRAYLIRGTVIAIRKCDASSVIIKR